MKPVNEPAALRIRLDWFLGLCVIGSLLVSTPLAIGDDYALIAEEPRAEGVSDLAQDLTNPVADLITLPIQTNFDFNFGPRDDGSRVLTSVQPVIPFDLNENWNLLSRTIVPVIYQEDIFPGAGSQFGFGDVNQSLFFSPKQPTPSGITWGAGPVLLFPTGTDPLLGGEKWAAGPTCVALRMQGPWTYGALTNHLWSYAGDDARADINNTFVQPVVAYTTPDAWTYSLSSESSYNWTGRAVVDPGECLHRQAGEDRQTAGKPPGWRRLLGRVTRFRPGRFPLPAPGQHCAA